MSNLSGGLITPKTAFKPDRINLDNMLSYSEQFFLLTVDPVSGRLFPVPEQALHLTLAGAFLFDASFQNLINDDWEQLEVLKAPDIENLALEEALRCLQVMVTSMTVMA